MTTAHEFEARTITGAAKTLAGYAGQVLLIVNVASACGLTPQYKGLEAEIKTFCESRYDVTFDMFSKVVVKGDGIHPLFAWLTSETGGDIKWNFGKFLIGKRGEILQRFEPNVEPDAPELAQAIDKALAG
jgi:glutathione peroxidase